MYVLDLTFSVPVRILKVLLEGGLSQIVNVVLILCPKKGNFFDFFNLNLIDFIKMKTKE